MAVNLAETSLRFYARLRHWAAKRQPNAMQMFLAGMALFWESSAKYIWPAFVVAGLFISAAFFELFDTLPGWLHAMLLAYLTLAFAAYVYNFRRRFRWPGMDAILRRIEIDSHLQHRPLTARADRLPEIQQDNPLAQSLWQKHQESLQKSLTRLTSSWPRFGFAPFDPWALRSILLLLLAVGAMQAGADWADRLGRAFQPSVPPASDLIAALSVSIKPPDYTRMPQINLAGRNGDAPIAVPQGSKLFVQFQDIRIAPRLSLDGEAIDVAALDPVNFQAEKILQQGGGKLKAYAGWLTLGEWQLEILPDLAPKIEFDAEPYVTERASLRIGYKGRDDYGIESASAVITKKGEAEKITLKLPAFGKNGGDFKNASYHDVAYHRWAGTKVSMQLIAEDALRQKTLSSPVEFTMPERIFKNPTAARIAELRKQYMFDQSDAHQFAQGLSGVLRDPASYKYDGVVTMALSVAVQRALHAQGRDVKRSLLALSWDIALRLEDEGVSIAERDLRGLEQALQDALSRGASMAEIEQLLGQFEQAMSDYLTAMYQQMQRDGLADLPALDPDSASVDVQDVDRLLEQIRQLLRSGNNEEAQKLLSKLQEVMANIRQNQGQQAESAKKAAELMKKAQALIRTQQQLLDHSHGLSDLAGRKNDVGERQKSVQDALAKFRTELKQLGAPEIKPYQSADYSMGHVRRLLREAFPAKDKAENPVDLVLQNQGDALEQLRAGLQELMKLMSSSGGGAGQMRAGSGKTDPFGRMRPGQGLLDDPSIKVPSVPELQRAKEILDELQDRSGDYSRPEVERDYINRLLRRF